LIHASRLTIQMTPAPYRSDGQQIVGARYKTGDDGKTYLDPHVYADFRLGIGRGYLARFEAFLTDGEGLFQNMETREEETRFFSQMKNGLRALLRRPEIWQARVDEGIRSLRELQELHGRVTVDVQGELRVCKLCAVIAAPDQDTAKQMVRYIEGCHSRMSVLLAVESWRLSEDNLRAFKMGDHDVIVTVGKCHIGYDHKPIKVVVNLNPTRWPGWLDNLIGRGLRIIPGREDIQCSYIGPADPGHVKWIEALRIDQDLGIADREGRIGPRGPREPAIVERILIARSGARLAMETEEQFDLSPPQLANVEEFTSEFGLQALPIRKLIRLMAEMGRSLDAPRALRESGEGLSDQAMVDLRTQEEKEREVRKALTSAAAAIDKKVMESDRTWDYGYSMTQCNRHFGWATSVGRCVEELEEALVWMEAVWLPACVQMIQAADDEGRVQLPEDWQNRQEEQS
jgi:hypothetical protein